MLTNYSLWNSLFWGNCLGHLVLVCQGSWGVRIVHFSIAMVEAIPIVGQIISIFEMIIMDFNYPAPPDVTPIAPAFPPGVPIELENAIKTAPDFNHYRVRLPNGLKTILTAMDVRPANLFYQAMGINVTQPGSGKLFALQHNPQELRHRLEQQRPQVIDFAATGYWGEVYGENHYRMGYSEVVDTLNSQQIHLSDIMSFTFYQGLKEAMRRDGMVILPDCTLRDYSRTNTHTGMFLREYPQILHYTFYEIATQVVKSEDYRIFMDENGKILQRCEHSNDAFRLINMCGLRNLRAPVLSLRNQTLMNHAFKTSFAAAHEGIAIYPAVGMGVWGGDPDLYWKAFLSAYIESPEANNLEAVCINPGHRPSPYGQYRGSTGVEFLQILAEYKAANRNNPAILAKLNKIIYLGSKDVIQLAHRLKQLYPNKTISLVNASDPDVTLGYHVGEYVNHRPHVSTTEENYTAMGTNGICFELLAQVHDPAQHRIHANIPRFAFEINRQDHIIIDIPS